MFPCSIFLTGILWIWISCVTLISQLSFVVFNSTNLLIWNRIIILYFYMNISLWCCPLRLRNNRLLFFIQSFGRVLRLLICNRITRLFYNWFHLHTLTFLLITFFNHWNRIITLFEVGSDTWFSHVNIFHLYFILSPVCNFYFLGKIVVYLIGF